MWSIKCYKQFVIANAVYYKSRLKKSQIERVIRYSEAAAEVALGFGFISIRLKDRRLY